MKILIFEFSKLSYYSLTVFTTWYTINYKERRSMFSQSSLKFAKLSMSSESQELNCRIEEVHQSVKYSKYVLNYCQLELITHLSSDERCLCGGSRCSCCLSEGAGGLGGGFGTGALLLFNRRVSNVHSPLR